MDIAIYFLLPIAGLFLLLMLFAAAYTSHSINRSEKRTYLDNYFVTPFEIHIPFENVQFKSEDDITLRGWWMARPGANVIVGCSGLNGSKSDLIGIGTHLWREGMNVLLFDCRDRGESDAAMRSGGYFELRDLRAAIHYAGMRAPGAPIGLIGYSMGASITILAAAENLAVRAVAADSPYESMESLLHERYRRMLLPGRLLFRIADRYNRLFFGYSLSACSPLESVGRISPRPLFLIHGALDSIIPAEHSKRLFGRAGDPKELWISEGADHCGAYFLDREAYCRRVAAFFRKTFAADGKEHPRTRKKYN